MNWLCAEYLRTKIIGKSRAKALNWNRFGIMNFTEHYRAKTLAFIVPSSESPASGWKRYAFRTTAFAVGFGLYILFVKRKDWSGRIWSVFRRRDASIEPRGNSTNEVKEVKYDHREENEQLNSAFSSSLNFKSIPHARPIGWSNDLTRATAHVAFSWLTRAVDVKLNRMRNEVPRNTCCVLIYTSCARVTQTSSYYKKNQLNIGDIQQKLKLIMCSVFFPHLAAITDP